MATKKAKNSDAWFDAFKSMNANTIKASLQKALADGADVNARSAIGQTALFHALWYPPVVALLLDAGIDVNATDEEGQTALIAIVDSATGSNKHYLESVKLLLRRGAAIDIQDKSGKTALYLAVQMGLDPYVKLLLEARANCKLSPKGGLNILQRAVEGHLEASSKKALTLLLKSPMLDRGHIAAAKAAAEKKGWSAIGKLRVSAEE